MRFDIIYLIVSLAITIISLIIHELAHGFTAYLLGDDTAKLNGRLTINPLSHIDIFLTIILPLSLALVGAPVFGGAKPVPFNPKNLKWHERGVALVAVAGPISNFIIAFVAFGVWVYIKSNVAAVNTLFNILISVNLGLFVFNLIPFSPLDGSRLLYALAPRFFRVIMEKIESFGIWPLLLLMLIANSAILRFMSYIIQMIMSAFVAVFAG